MPPLSTQFQGVFPESHLAAPLVIWAVDTDRRFILSEGAGLRSIGIVPGQAVGHRVDDYYPDDQEVLGLVTEALAGRRYFSSRKVGDQHWESRCAPLYDSQRRIVGAVAVSSEIVHTPAHNGHSSDYADLYRQLASTLPVMTYIADSHAPFSRLYISSQFQAILGFPTTAWLDDDGSWLAIVHPDDRQNVLSHLRQAVQEPRVVQFGYRLRDARGLDVYVEERVVAVRLASGQPLCLQGIILDVTARKQAETRYAKSDQYLRLIVESAGDGIFTVDRNGYINYANPRLAEMLELGDSELLNTHFSEYLMPDDRQPTVERFERRMAGLDEPREYELQLLTQRGNVFWAEVSLTPLQSADRFDGNLVFIRDITRRKQVDNSLAEMRTRLEQRVAERTHEMRLANKVMEEQIEHAREVTHKLQTSEARWRSLVEHAPQYILLINPDLNLMFINRTAPGYDMDQVEGSSLLDFIPEHNRAFTQRILNRVFTEGAREDYEIDGFGPNGEPAWYSISVGPITSKPGESPAAAVMIAADITQKRATEEALQKRQQELAHISRLNTMGALTAELAHELNQPLEAISAYANACQRALALNGHQLEDDRVETALHNIGMQSRRAGQIIRKIMDFLRKGNLPRQLTDINQLVREVVQFVDFEARRHQVTFQCDLSVDLPHVPANRVQIEQVLVNLMLNAVDAVRDQQYERREIQVVSRKTSDEDIVISVIDQGCGFAAEIAEDIFQPFYTTKGNGMGMGLSISRTIIDEHGGRIWATSIHGAGATFAIQLPTAGLRPGERGASAP